MPRAITPDGVTLAGKNRGAGRVLRPRSRRRHMDALSIRRRWSACSLAPASVPLQWSHSGRYCTVARPEGARPPAVDVFRVDLTTGVRRLWKTLTPSDPVGVEDMKTVVITPDAQSCITPTSGGLATCS